MKTIQEKSTKPVCTHCGQRHSPQIATKRHVFLALGLISFLSAWLLPAGFSRDALFIISYLLAGLEIIKQALTNLKQGRLFDENFLMSLATLGALAIKEYPEAAAVMLFYRTGELLQDLAVDKSRRSIAALLAVKPEIAHKRTKQGIADIPVEEVLVGDELAVRPGERIPVDGTVLEGFSDLDTSPLTGESMPRSVAPGSEVLAGSINLAGLLNIRANKLASDSSLEKILHLVENASAHKAPAENFITVFSRYYTPAVVAAAIGIASLPPLFGAPFSDWFYRALIFLVISCPCALVISIPLTFFAGIGGASRQGILVKGSNHLHTLSAVDTVVFDKTGTLTSGSFQVQNVLAAPPFSPEEVLKLAAKVERGSTHPIALSIVKAAPDSGDQTKIESLQELPGLGVQARVQGQKILVGRKSLLEQEGIPVPAENHQSGVYVAVDGHYAGLIVLADTPKKSARRAVQILKQMGLGRIVMLTGDNLASAERAGRDIGIEDIRAGLLPREKVAELEKIMKEGKKGKVAFVGDGINDAPALARADVGLAMGALGSDAAIETADVVLMGDEPLALARALQTARRTKDIIWQNIFLILGVKLAVLLLGALGKATLWEAIFADVGVAVLAVLNSLRALPGANSVSDAD